MLLTDLILSKKGPLAKVWISAHHERKLSKAQALQIDVNESIEAILEDQVEPLALRMSGQLMLGVVRIYSRKAQYLMDDCKDVRDKITMAFRPGQVDLPADQLMASRNAITNQESRNDFDLFLGDFQWDFAQRFPQAYRNIPEGGGPLPPSIPGRPNNNLGTSESINLPQHARQRSLYAASIRSGSVSVSGVGGGRGGSVNGDGSGIGIGSNSFDAGYGYGGNGGYGNDDQELMEEMDLGLDLGDDDSIEIGRHRQDERAASVASSMRVGGGGVGGGMNQRLGNNNKRGGSLSDSNDTALPMDGGEGEDLEQMDLGFDLPELGGGGGGGGFEMMDVDMDEEMNGGGDKMPGMIDDDDDDEVDPDRARRESTRLTTPPPADELTASTRALLGQQLTPRTASRISKIAEQQEARALSAQKKREAENGLMGGGGGGGKRVRVMRADEEIELEEGESLGRRDVSAILGKENYLPSSRAMIALMRIREDPASFYLPTIKKGTQTYFLTTNGSVAPELADLFMIPTNVLRRGVGEGEDDEGYARKKPRLNGPTAQEEGEEEEGADVEMGRRQSQGRGGGLSQRFDQSGMDLHLGGGNDDGFDLDQSGGNFDEGDEMNLGAGGGNDTGMNFDLEGSPTAHRGQDKGKARAGSLVPSSRAGSVMPPPSISGTQQHVASAEGCLIAAFDARLNKHESSQSQSQIEASQYGGEMQGSSMATAAESKKSGLGKNTLLAIDVLRGEVQAEGEETSFERLASQASRRAAASFFFELLVLGTKDAVKIQQDKAYGDITVGAKEKLWTLATDDRESVPA